MLKSPHTHWCHKPLKGQSGLQIFFLDPHTLIGFSKLTSENLSCVVLHSKCALILSFECLSLEAVCIFSHQVCRCRGSSVLAACLLVGIGVGEKQESCMGPSLFMPEI